MYSGEVGGCIFFSLHNIDLRSNNNCYGYSILELRKVVFAVMS